MTARRKLIEVALPLDAINRESAREKSIRHGHPSTLYLWWARRPLAACRAILFASYVDDPSSHPDRFPTEESRQAERERLFEIIRKLVKWANTTNLAVLDAARAEILRSCGGNPPPVYNPCRWMCDEAERRIGHLYPEVTLPTEHGDDVRRTVEENARTVHFEVHGFEGE